MQEFEPTFLVERPKDQRVWVVRASGGHFVPHFRRDSLMAIGHLNDVGLPDGPVGDATSLEFERLLKVADEKRKQNSITSHAKQAEVFCSAIKEDDLVVTLDSSAFMVGRVLGPAYVDSAPVVIERPNAPSDKMPHRLRRKVSWGPMVERNAVPVALEMTLQAHQTVFNIDRYWTAVYHLLYPCFTFEGRLYLSANIKQQQAIDNYSVSQLFSLLSGVEVMAKLLARESEEWQSYPKNLPALDAELDLALSSKAEFMSPGTVWSTLLSTDTMVMAWAALIYVMLFGGKIVFFKSDGLIDIHTRQKLWERVLRLKEVHDVDKIKKKLKVEVPKLDTEKLEVPAQKAKRTRRKSVAVPEEDVDKQP